ncbi:CCHC-type domain-containing protein [Trichonephila clavipes]|nr:CCHC-type domain-containing protein [Trichonephila clavipes]
MIFIQKFAITCRAGLWNKQMPYFSSVSDEWSRDLKSVQAETAIMSRIANQSANQNNGQTSRVKSLDEIVKNGEEELKDYESLKQVVLKEYEPSPKICLENFRKAKRNSDETFSQFASRLTSMGYTTWDCPKNKEVDNKRLNVNKVSTEGTELVDGTVATRVDVLGKVIPRRAIEDKLSKLVKTFISGRWEVSPCVIDSGTEITVIKKDLVPGISAEGASNDLFERQIFGPAVKCPLVYVPLVLLPVARVKRIHSAQSSQDLRVDSGNVDETEVLSVILPEKAQEHIEDSQRNITSCRNEVGTLGTKDEEVTAEMDKGIMVADSFRSEQECCAELALVWKYAKEGKGNYYEVDGYLFRRDKILGRVLGSW